MNLRELIDSLTDLAAEHGDNVEVRLAHQPAYPFEYSLETIAAVDLAADEEGDDDEGAEPGDAVIVYLGEGQQLGYLSGHAAAELGWSRS